MGGVHSNVRVISLSFRGRWRALDGESAMFNFEGPHPIHTFIPPDAARAQKAEQICVARSEVPDPAIGADAALLLSTNRITGVRLACEHTRNRAMSTSGSSRS